MESPYVNACLRGLQGIYVDFRGSSIFLPSLWIALRHPEAKIHPFRFSHISIPILIGTEGDPNEEIEQSVGRGVNAAGNRDISAR
jgi:hypothetical protein